MAICGRFPRKLRLRGCMREPIQLADLHDLSQRGKPNMHLKHHMDAQRARGHQKRGKRLQTTTSSLVPNGMSRKHAQILDR